MILGSLGQILIFNGVKMIRIILLLYLTISLISNPAVAAVSFTNGLFSTSYDCADWTGATVGEEVCSQGIIYAYGYCAGVCAFPCEATTSCSPEQILASTNNPLGSGGAQMHYYVMDASGVGITNDHSGGLTFTFPSGLTEVWIRFYTYYPSDVTLGINEGHKTLYTDTTGGSSPWLAIPYGSEFIGWYFPDGSGIVKSTDYLLSGFDYHQWFAVELHLKVDTNGTDGVVQVWRNNTLIINRSNIDFGTSTIDSFNLGSNGNNGNSGPPSAVWAVRYDDVAIATVSYTGFIDDGNGYDRIGLLSTLVNGACGTASGQSFSSLTSNSPNLCDAGTVDNFTGTGGWTWDCAGSGGGTTDDTCYADYTALEDGVCGSADGGTFSSLTSGSPNLCDVGAVANFVDSNGYTWDCTSTGNPDNCTASHAQWLKWGGKLIRSMN